MLRILDVSMDFNWALSPLHTGRIQKYIRMAYLNKLSIKRKEKEKAVFNY